MEEIAVVKPAKQWTYAGNPHLSGAVEPTRLDAKALGVVPLGLEQVGIWNPAEHYWGEEGDPIEDWAKPVIARGPRPEFEMEQVLPGLDVEDPFSDPIGQSNDRKDSGDFDGSAADEECRHPDHHRSVASTRSSRRNGDWSNPP